MSIKHFEDLPLPDIVDVIRNLSDYEITEKLDGSQLLFGLDEVGFYTTRGKERFYTADQYEINFSTTYRRFAHSALQSSLPKLLAAGMVPGDQVEIEVLHGELPNVVPYHGDVSYIIFLRTTAGSVNIDRLEQEFSGHSLTVTLSSPFTTDGINVTIELINAVWKFDRVPVIKYEDVYLESELSTIRDKFEQRMIEKSSHPGKSVFELATLNLSRLPVPEREAAKNRRASLQDSIQRMYIKPMKAILLKHLVYGKASKFGPDTGWIEGVVLRHKTTGKMVKLVDKDTFGKLHSFFWSVRNSLDVVSSRKTILSLLDKYNKEKHAMTFYVPRLSREFRYTGEIDRRTLEVFAFKINQAEDETRRDHSNGRKCITR